MTDLISHSSSIGRCWVHLAFKVKYCHKIFDIPEIKDRTEQLLFEAMNRYGIMCREMGTDRDHVHFVLDLGLLSVSHVAKLLKGYTAKHLLREYPFLKKQYFWRSGLWNPSYYFDSLGRDIEELSLYVRRQSIPMSQKKLVAF